MLAGLPGMGLVAKQVVDYFIRKLDAELIGEIEETYPSTNTIIYNNGVFLNIPRATYRFYYWSDRDREAIFFTGTQQPLTAERQHELAEQIVKIAKDFNVRRIYTTAALAVVRYVDKPRVYGVVTSPGLLIELKKHGIEVLTGEGTIRGLNGLLIGYAREAGIEGMCLLGETYLVDSVDVLAALAVMRKLINITGIQVDLTEAEEIARRLEEETEKVLKKLKKEEDKRLGYIS